MALMMGKLDQALRRAGVEENLAREAAEEVANYHARIEGLERKLDALDAKVDRRCDQLEGKFTLLSWMLGFNLAFTVGVLWKVLTL